MSVSHALVRRLAVLAVIVSCSPVTAALARTPPQPPAGDFSPAFLGMYRKVMRIDAAIDRYSRRVDPQLNIEAAGECLTVPGR